MRLIITAIMTIIVSFTSMTSSFADGNDNVKTYKFENNISMNGVISSSSKFFYVGNNWDVKNAKLNLVFTKSELLDIDYSTITVLINDTPIHSEKLDGKKEYKKESVIEIPKDLIKPGYNEIKIKAYKTMSDMICRDDSNTANWLVIHKESNINLQYGYKQSSNILSEYPNLYINTDNGSKLNTTIVVPDNYTSSDINAGMILSSNFGQNIKNNDFNFDLQRYSDFKNKSDNVIFIGNPQNLPAEILNLLNENERSNLNEKCIIKMTNSIFDNNKKLLLIVSENGELLKKASKLLSSNELINNLTKESIVIDSSTDVDDLKVETDRNKIYLKDLGYENIVLKGPFSQEVIMEVNTPKSKVVEEQTNIKLDIRYAQNLDFERSLATVYVNDIPIGSKKLSADKCNSDSIELSLPKELIGLNYYQIKVVFNLELLDLACVTRDTENPWAYISNESFIDFNYRANNDLKFANYPYPFIQNGKFENLTVVIPENIGSSNLTSIANIIAYMGHDINFNDGNLNVVKESEFKDEHKKDNLMIIGTPMDSNIIKDINKSLNLKFKGDFTGFESNDKVKFVGEYSSEVATLQLLASPYSKDKSAIVIASTDIKDLNLSTKYLTDMNLTNTLKGDTVVIGRNGYIQDVEYRVKEDANKADIEDKQEVKEEKKISKQGKVFIFVAVFLLVTLITSVVLLVLKYKK